MATVSVVMPAFNAAGTLGAALASLRAQTREDIEIVVVDDGSTDGTAAVMRSHAAEDRRVKVVEFPSNRGVVAAMNHGVAEARGELVARMDADDLAHRERISRQAALLEKCPEVSVCATGVRIVAGGDGYGEFERWVNGLVTHEAMARERFIETPVVNPSAMIRRAAWDAVGGVRDLPWAEDYDLWLRLFEQGHRFAKVQDVLLDWNDSPGRLTRRDRRYSQRAFLQAKAHYLARLPGLRERGVRICGAGPTGKRLARDLIQKRVKVEAFYEVNPRRIGEEIAGAPVHDQRDLVAAGGAVLVGAVGRPGARARLRGLATSCNYTEGGDFWLVA